MITLLVFSLIFAFCMAWMIGANDVANAMGTSVGSKALTLKQAVLLAAIFEFGGAFLVGGGVTDTVRKGIINPDHFMDANLFPQAPAGAATPGPSVKPTLDTGPGLFALGMLCALITAVLWLFLTNRLGIPVSTTHSIVGAIIGFGLAALVPKIGWQAIEWASLGKISIGWVVSPVAGGVLSFIMFVIIRRYILRSPTPLEAVRTLAPYLLGLVIVVVVLSVLVKGLKNFHLEIDLWSAFAAALLVATLAGIFMRMMSRSHPPSERLEDQFFYVEGVFRRLQIVTACYVAFAHGSNDVANAVGPLAGILEVWKTGVVGSTAPIQSIVLAIGGLGIVLGLAMWGYRVIETVGKKITEMTPSRGFCAEFGAATIVLLFSMMKLPISTTQTLVGAVLGVGLARGLASIDMGVIRKIFSAWIIELPLTAAVTATIFLALQFIFT
ncbi:MAG: inorganic phosphate transporter [Planctomycetota bacterium]|nr:inorganic phosphate transporter [Planctomycetota bacterium]